MLSSSMRIERMAVAGDDVMYCLEQGDGEMGAGGLTQNVEPVIYEFLDLTIKATQR